MMMRIVFALECLFLHLFCFMARADDVNSINNSSFVPPTFTEGELNVLCEECIERSEYEIQIIVHGKKGDPFWMDMKVAWDQMAYDTGVDYKWTMYDIDTTAYSIEEAMAADIRAAAKKKRLPDALIVSIPGEQVQTALAEVISDGTIPVFGVNTGYDVSKKLGLQNHVAMDEKLGGILAAAEFMKEQPYMAKALFINHEPDNVAMQERFEGFAQTLLRNETLAQEYSTYYTANNETRNYPCGCASCEPVWFNMAGEFPCGSRIEYLRDVVGLSPNEACITIAQVEFPDECGACDPGSCPPAPEVPEPTTVEYLDIGGVSDDQVSELMTEALEGCTYNAILLSGGLHFEKLTSAYYANACRFDAQVLGAFDTNGELYVSLSLSKLKFLVGQQQHLQASVAYMLAVIKATTGLTLDPSSETSHGAYLTGPKVVTIQNIPTDTMQQCEAEGYFVCRDGKEERRGLCNCQARDVERFVTVIPDPYASPATWLHVWKGAEQAAKDTNIAFEINPLTNADENANSQLSEKIKSVCRSGVRGVLTAVKSQAMLEAVQFCEQELNTRVVSVTSDPALTAISNMKNVVTMSHYNSGYGAGERMAPEISEGWCVNWHYSNDLDGRCFGFRDALVANGKIYRGVIYPLNGVSFHDNIALFKTTLETFITDDGDWDGQGLFLTSDPFVEGAEAAQQAHPKLKIATNDVGESVEKFLRQDKLLFAIDSQPYLQSYVGLWLLMFQATIGEYLATKIIEVAPIFVYKENLRPGLTTSLAVQCFNEDGRVYDAHKVCEPPILWVKNQLGSLRPVGMTIAAFIVSLCIAFLVWTIIFRKLRIVKSSQPAFLILICVGASIAATSIIPLGLDDEVLHKDGGCLDCECKACSRACMATPWLFTIGFTIMFSALFSKIWRINKLMSSAKKFRRVQVRAQDVVLPMSVLLVLNIVFMSIWTGVDPMYFERTQQCGSDLLTSYGGCRLGEGPVSVAMAASVAGVNFLALALANLQAYKARKVNTELSESSSIGLAMGSIMQILMVGVPLAFLVNDSPPAKYFILVSVIGITCLSVVLLMFIPKVRKTMEFKKAQREALAAGERFDEARWFRQNAGSNSGSTKSNWQTSESSSRKKGNGRSPCPGATSLSVRSLCDSARPQNLSAVSLSGLRGEAEDSAIVHNDEGGKMGNEIGSDEVVSEAMANTDDDVIEDEEIGVTGTDSSVLRKRNTTASREGPLAD